MKVRVNATYIYHANLLDRCDGRTDLTDGELVRVINLHGAPKANTMGHCYVERANTPGVFVGMVSTNSLHTREDYITYLKERIGTHSENPRNKAAIVSTLRSAS